MFNGKADWPDIISEFMELTEEEFTSAIFRRWAAIALVGGALERRVWYTMGRKIGFPNEYIMLVGKPGVGKYIIERVEFLWKKTLEPGTKSRAFKVAPKSMTKASLVDALAKAKAARLIPGADPFYSYNSLLVAAEELAIFLPSYDGEFIGTLNGIWNNPPDHTETRRTGMVKEIDIENPQLNIITGAQPALLGSMFPDDAWNSGLMSRFIMIYSEEDILRDPFADTIDTEVIQEKMLAQLGQVSQLYGAAQWGPGARDMVRDWHMSRGFPSPKHSKLEHYSRRRTRQHMPKLALICGVSRTGHTLIETQDVSRAMTWLVEAEKVMPDIFRAMLGKSDHQIIEELYNYVLSTQAESRARPWVPDPLVQEFLSLRVPVEKMSKVLEAALSTGYIERIAGTTNFKAVPKAHRIMGVE